MTEERFEELINLYIDREISSGELAELRQELKCNADRKVAFVELMRLETASKKALFSHTRSNLMQKSKPQQALPSLEATTACEFGLFRWGVLGVCTFFIGLQWFKSIEPQMLPQQNPVFYEWAELEGFGQESLHSVSIADIVEVRNVILSLFPDFEVTAVPLEAIVSSSSNPAGFETISESDPKIMVRELLERAAQQRKINRPFEVYPFHGNVANLQLEPESATMRASPAPSSRFHFLQTGTP